jgi:hypothetical protein
VKTVQARLGHASATETLNAYAHLWPDSEDHTRAGPDLGSPRDAGSPTRPEAFPQVGRFGAASRPVRRILCGPRSVVAIHLGRRLPDGSCGLPGIEGRAVLSLLGLAPGGACRAARVTPGAGALLPHRFTLTCAPGAPGALGGLLSVALSCGSPRLGVTQHRALWSPDVPRTDRAGPRPPGRLAATPTLRRPGAKGSDLSRK